MLIEEEEDFKKIFRVVFSDFPGNDNGGCENITASMALGSHAGKKNLSKASQFLEGKNIRGPLQILVLLGK